MNTFKFILGCILATFISNKVSAQSIADKIEQQNQIFTEKKAIVNEKKKDQRDSLYNQIKNAKDNIITLYNDSIGNIISTNNDLVNNLNNQSLEKQKTLDSLAIDNWLNIDEPSIFIPVNEIPTGKIHKSREGYYTLITKICALKELLSRIEVNINIKKQYDEGTKALTRQQSEALFDAIKKSPEDVEKLREEINNTNEIFKNSLSKENTEYYLVSLMDKYIELMRITETLTK